MNPFELLQGRDEEGNLTKAGARTRRKKAKAEAEAEQAKQLVAAKLKAEVARKKKQKADRAAQQLKARREGAVSRLTKASFVSGENTYVWDLPDKYKIRWAAHAHILHAHLTIDKNHLDTAVAGAETVRDVFVDLPYHVTFAEGAELYDPGNPRWYSVGGWALNKNQQSLQNANGMPALLDLVQRKMAELAT